MFNLIDGPASQDILKYVRKKKNPFKNIERIKHIKIAWLW